MLINILLILTLLMLYAFYKSKFERYECIDIIFFGMWICFAVEYYATTDYPVYYENFDRTYIHVAWEPGYRLLLMLFQPFGFYVFNAVVAAFEMYTLCFMFKKFCPPRYLWIGILIFLLDVENMLGYMCLKRQFFAMAISMWTLYYTCWSDNKRRWLYAALLFMASASIHTSALVSAVYFLIPFIRFRINYVMMALMGGVFVWSLTFNIENYGEQLMDIYNIIGDKNIDNERYAKYIDTLDDAIFRTVLSKAGPLVALAYIASFVLLLFYNRKVSERQYRLVLLSLLSYIFGNMLVGDLYRLNHYFTMTTFFTIPVVLNRLVEDGRRQHKSVYYFVAVFYAVLWLGNSAKSYYNVFTGTKVTYMTLRFKHFPTIFDQNVDKSVYLFNDTKEIE